VQPRPPANLPDRQPLHEPHPTNLGPLLHADHPSSPDPIADDRARVGTQPDDTEPARVGQFSTGVGGPVFSRRRQHPRRRLRGRPTTSNWSTCPSTLAGGTGSKRKSPASATSASTAPTTSPTKQGRAIRGSHHRGATATRATAAYARSSTGQGQTSHDPGTTSRKRSPFLKVKDHYER
jgi:hypothetical protein